MTRAQAKRLKLTRYFTGKPCLRGHIAERLTCSSACVPCFKAREKKRNNENPKSQNKRKQRWRKKHPGAGSGRVQRWRKANPEKGKAINVNRRARQNNAAGSHTSEDLTQLFFLQKGKCAGPTCGCKIHNGYHVDHKTPLSRGGSNWPRNLQLLCAPCNGSKSVKTQREWHRSLISLRREGK